MLTVGIDLAAEDANTAVARIAWTSDEASVEDVLVGAGDELLVKAIATADKAGIECPLGWPVPFVEFISAHHSGTLATRADLVGRDWRKSLAWRRTDLVAREVTGLVPLSVAQCCRCGNLVCDLMTVDPAHLYAVIEDLAGPTHAAGERAAGVLHAGRGPCMGARHYRRRPGPRP